MKWEDLRRSRNVQDRRGQSSGMGGGSGMRRSGLGGGMGSLLLMMLAGRGGKFGLIILVLLMLFGGGLGGLFNSGTDNTTTNSPGYEQTQPNDQAINRSNPNSSTNTASRGQATDTEVNFLSAVLGSTEDFWGEKLANYDIQYSPAQLIVYSDYQQTGGCGLGSAAAGPFYCPADESIYIDLSFYRDLSQKYQAPGDFAMAYVLAHEVGHHIQNEIGVMNSYQQAVNQTRSESARNQLNVRLELQADYFAGAWARYAENQGLLDVGDIEEAMQAAHAVGDDTLQEQAYGRVVPDSFTHGTSQQRQAWFMRGYQYGDLEHGDTFNTQLGREGY
ncbi:neutral zinc metallopeptidase [Aerococcaceae bacterium DSM 111020]|nr:neutral zinc metallopeptidase [Aerococcaceae bacterium DSM 111020]